MEKYINKISNFLFLMFLTLLILIIYKPSMNGDFCYMDDYGYLDSIEDLNGNYLEILDPNFDKGSYYKPLFILSLLLDFLLWKASPLGFHFTSVLIYLFTLYIIYFIVYELFKNKFISVMSTILFAVHPVHVETVSWISSRTHLLGSFFFCVAFYLFIKFNSNKKKLFYFLSLFAFLCSLLSHVISGILPLIILLYIYCFTSSIKGKVNFYKILPVIPYFFLTLLFAVFLTYTGAVSHREVHLENTFLDRFVIFIILFAKLIKLFFWPFNLSLFYSSEPAQGIFSLSFLLSFFIFIFFVLSFLYTFVRHRELAFSLGWFLLPLLFISGRIFANLEFYIADRYLYLPSFGMCLFFTIIFYRLLYWKKIREKNMYFSLYSALFLVISVLIILTVYRSAVWENSFSLWSDTLKKAPDKSYAHFCIAVEYDRMNLREDAILEYKKAIAIDNTLIVAHLNIAANYYIEKNYDKAIYHIKEVLKSFPEHKKARFLLKRLYQCKLREVVGRDDAFKNISEKTNYYLSKKRNYTIEELCELITLNPFCEQAYMELGLKLHQEGRSKEALQVLYRMKELFPYRYEDINKTINSFNDDK